MKVTSKDFYAIFRESLAPVMKKAGFKRLKMGSLGWTRPENNGYLCVWVHVDKYGWFPDFGSKFMLEFELGTKPELSTNTLDKMRNFTGLLSPDELETVRVLNNSVVQALPPPQPSNPFWALNEEWQKMFMLDYQIRVEPYPPNDYVWLHYFTRQDVEVWAVFFKERILRMTSDFLAQV